MAQQNTWQCAANTLPLSNETIAQLVLDTYHNRAAVARLCSAGHCRLQRPVLYDMVNEAPLLGILGVHVKVTVKGFACKHRQQKQQHRDFQRDRQAGVTQLLSDLLAAA